LFILKKMSQPYPAILNPTQEDIQKMLACQVHMGTRNLEPGMEQYVWKRRSDGIYIIDLKKTWEKLILAARVIVAIENPSEVVLVSMRPHGQRAVLKFSQYVGSTPLAGRFTPGTFTNQIQKKFIEPRLLIAQDPRTDHQPLRESSYVNVPTIAFTHTDASLRYVDIAIPANNKGKHAVGLMYWLLAREVLYMRGSVTCNRSKPWDVMVDMFFYRNPDEAEKEQEHGESHAAIEGAHAETPAAEGGFSDPFFGQSAPASAAAGGALWDNSVVAGTGSWGADA
jgi:small subunit ribosomal protein SAe